MTGRRTTSGVRTIRFMAVGAIGIAVQLGALHLLADVTRLDILLAAPVSIAMAIIHNFVWHRGWTWRDRHQLPWLAGLARFGLANGAVSLIGNTFVTAALVRIAGWTPVAANALAIVVCGVFNYWLADRVVFLDRPVTRQVAPIDGGYSARSAASGSTRDARQAGTAPETKPTAISTTLAIVSVAGSRGDSP